MLWAGLPVSVFRNDMNAPLGTALYNLPLLGQGTAEAESLTSYIVRLARAHFIRPRDLIRRVAGEADAEIAALCYSWFFTRYALTANGLGNYAQLFSTRLGELTGNQELDRATLLPWRNLIAPNGSSLLALHPRWCPHCLAADARTGAGPYLRLVWSVALNKHCIKHHIPLEGTCPHCGHFQPVIPQTPDLLHCDRCMKPLVIPDALVRLDHIKPVNEILRTEEIIAELIEANVFADSSTTHARFVEHLECLVIKKAAGNRSAFSASLGLQARALNGWLRKGQRVSLELLVHIFLATGLRPAQIVPKGSLGKCDQIGILPQRNARTHKRHSSAVRQCVGEMLKLAIASSAAAPSLITIARQLGVSRAYLRYWFPRLVDELVEKRRALIKKNADLRTKKHVEVIRAAIDEAISQGVWPGTKRIDSAARHEKFSLMDEDMFRAYQCLLSEALAQSNLHSRLIGDR